MSHENLNQPISLASGIPSSPYQSLATQPINMSDYGLTDMATMNAQMDSALNSINTGGNVGGGFFTQGNSFMQNAGDVVGLAGGVMSLADMLNNWGMGKKMMKTNIANVRQQMANNQEAFDRSKARQDRSLAAVRSADEKAKEIQQGG